MPMRTADVPECASNDAATAYAQGSAPAAVQVHSLSPSSGSTVMNGCLERLSLPEARYRAIQRAVFFSSSVAAVATALSTV